jgi:hypothetical protein
MVSSIFLAGGILGHLQQLSKTPNVICKPNPVESGAFVFSIKNHQ